ncbi:Lipoprotein [Methylorubrum aminovorans]
MPLQSRQMFAAAVVLILAGCGEEKPAEYVSQSGFQPFIHKREGRITYQMLDVISEDGPIVRYVTKQEVPPGGLAGGMVNYASRRGDCHQLVYQTIGEGDTVAKMERDRPEDHWVELVNGSSATAALVTACQVAKKLK